MREFLSENRELIISLVTVIMSLMVDGLIGLGIALGFSRRRIRQLTRSGYKVRCPHCKKESPIEECSFLMASGQLDNNLNGIPDELENQ